MNALKKLTELHQIKYKMWILFTLSSLPGIFKFDILILNIFLFVLTGSTPYSGFTGLNNILYIYIYIYIYTHTHIYILIL